MDLMILTNGEASMVGSEFTSNPGFQHQCRTPVCEGVEEAMRDKQNLD